MSEYFEIAYAAASNRLCLLTGTGFSKAVTGDAAPNWQALLEKMCDKLDDPEKIKSVLFTEDGKNPLSLEESAQVIAIELAKSGKKIHDEIAKYIKKIKLDGDNSVMSDFFKNNSLRIVTTNYDKFAEQLADSEQCQSIAPGFPIPRSDAEIKVFHVHGSVDSPENMLVTSDDYYRFMNEESYFSRKLSTVLHENTVVILGYSLGDTNLKAIISDYRGFARDNVIGSSLFLISKNRINQYIKDYYSCCYGIRVLDRIHIHDFFERLNSSMKEANKCLKSSIESTRKVLFKDHHFTDNYLKVEMSFFEIIASIAAIGKSINDPIVVETLGKIIKKKIEFTTISGAWEQYEHLANWLIYLASILELKKTSIEEVFLDAVLKSMETMKQEYYIGYSWHAYTLWSTRWSRIISSNRAMIKAYIEKNTRWSEALDVVRDG